MINEELAQKILDDIQFIRKNTELFQKKLVDHKLDEQQLTEIRSVLNYFRTADFKFLSTMSNQQDLLELENQFSPYKISMETFIERPDLKQRLDNFIEENNRMYSYMGRIVNIINGSTNAVFPPSNPENLHDELQEIYKRIKTLEQEQKPVNEIVIAYSNEINAIKEKITDLQSSDTQIEITKTLTQANQLFEKASNSEKILDEKIQTLINTSEKQVAYTLSEQFEKKTASLKRPIWINFTLMFILILVLSFQSMKYVELMLDPKITNEAYWHALVMVILIKVPMIFLILFVLNEYTKAKKLFEEYEHKRIMAATLVNNLERLKNELHADEKDLLKLIKVPFEKIFDNPVHSIYGDKSGDKNIGLDQLEKLTSIIEKMKNTNQ